MTDNKTLLKQFANIYSSCNKAKQGALAEIGKIDDKYRKLAEKEKEQLNELVKALDSQMEMYGNYLGLNQGEKPIAEDIIEEKVKDELFPENNEETAKSDEKESEETPEPVAVPVDGTVATDAVAAEWPAVEEKEVVKLGDSDDTTTEVWEVDNTEPKEEKKEVPALEVGEDGWPEFPEDWK